MNNLRNRILQRVSQANAAIRPRLTERQLVHYALLSIVATLLVVLAHQTYGRRQWEQFRAAHGCEATEFTDDLAQGMVKRAWSCDDGFVYYR